jgi:hypothetical protein
MNELTDLGSAVRFDSCGDSVWPNSKQLPKIVVGMQCCNLNS